MIIVASMNMINSLMIAALVLSACGAAPPRLNAALPQKAIAIHQLEGANGQWVLTPNKKGYKVRDAAGKKLGKITFKGEKIKFWDRASGRVVARAKRKGQNFRIYHSDGSVALRFKKTKSQNYKIKGADKTTIGKLKRSKARFGESKVTAERAAATQKVSRDGQQVAEVDASVATEAALLLGLSKELTPQERVVAMLARMVF